MNEDQPKGIWIFKPAEGKLGPRFYRYDEDGRVEVVDAAGSGSYGGPPLPSVAEVTLLHRLLPRQHEGRTPAIPMRGAQDLDEGNVLFVNSIHLDGVLGEDTEN